MISWLTTPLNSRTSVGTGSDRKRTSTKHRTRMQCHGQSGRSPLAQISTSSPICSPLALDLALAHARLSASEVMTLRNPTRLGSLELKVSDWRRRAASPSKTYIGRSVSTTLLRSARRRTTKPRPFFECLLAWQRPLPNAAGLLVRRNEDDRWQDGLRHCWQTH